MEYLKKDELYKNRGYAKCISCGYHAIIDNFKSIFSYTWKSALAYGLVEFVALAITDGFVAPTDATGWVVWGVMLAAVVVSNYYMFANIVNMFSKQGKSVAFRKLLELLVWGVVISVLLMLVMFLTAAFSYSSQYNAEILIGVFALISLLVLILGIPFGYLTVKFLVEDEKHFFNVIKSGFRKGFSHWGLIFVSLILSVFFVALASFVVALPLYILVIAKFLSETGVTLGDASGMPGYFPYIFAITSAIVSVILVYFNSSIFSTLYFTYGSIEQRENERIGFMEKNSMKI